jgi:hypothetical protein
MALAAIKNFSSLPMSQGVIQNGGRSLDTREMQVNFEVAV